MSDLFSPWRIGPHALAHRVVMAPLTRMRAGADGVPPPLAATYYAQRAKHDADGAQQPGELH